MNTIRINTKKERFETAPDLYGLFFEDINHAADGGLYPEMIRNRAFEDSIVPDGCTTDEEHRIIQTAVKWTGAFNHGEGVDEWAEAVRETEIPAWYSENAEMQLDTEDVLNKNRKASLKVDFKAGGSVENIGYCGIPAKNGEQYRFSAFIKSNASCTLKVSIEGVGTVYASESIFVEGGDSYKEYAVQLTSEGTDYDAKFKITSVEGGRVTFGFTSLLPEKTFCGHGLREDLALALKNTNSKFIRFPGGCVVEGINEENTLAFHKTIGPVHERPSSWLMWHYRTTNGLGFHEYLQLCEDLQMEAMYVFNCGISCQGRGNTGYSEEKTKEYLQEALDAMEYAMGPVDSHFGSMRAAYGHPEPFKIKYVEIGNENGGPEYNERYAMFYDILKKKYPDVIYISNTHTEGAGLPTEVADEHYYNSPEYFLERGDMFDTYDRQGPKILAGEYAVYMLLNEEDVIASQKCAVAEAAFLTGCERNQDVIRLASYAPLFQNCHYTGWSPNLIVFDNHQVYGIPSYHVISLMGKYRGTHVVELQNESEKIRAAYIGVPGIQSSKDGLEFKNVKINGVPVSKITDIHGTVEETESGSYRMIPDHREKVCVGKCDAWNKGMQEFSENMGYRFGDPHWAIFGEEDLQEMTYEIDVKFTEDNPVTLSVWNSYPNTDYGTNEPKGTEWVDFLARNQIWRIEGGTGATRNPSLFDKPLAPEERTPLKIQYNEFNHCEIRCTKDGFTCYLNGEAVQSQELRERPVIMVSCETTEEEVYVKLVNPENRIQSVQLTLDIDIEPEIHIEKVTAEPDAVNSFEKPLNVCADEDSIVGNGTEVQYDIPANTVSVLVMKKAK